MDDTKQKLLMAILEAITGDMDKRMASRFAPPSEEVVEEEVTTEMPPEEMPPDETDPLKKKMFG